MFKMADIAELHWTAKRADTLREARDKAKFSLRELADKMAEIGYPTNRSTLHYLESGKSKTVNPLVLEGVCKVLSLKLSEFMDVFYFEMGTK